jgi:hypothetical protein
MTRRPIFPGRHGPSWPPRLGPTCKATWDFVPRRRQLPKRLS